MTTSKIIVFNKTVNSYNEVKNNKTTKKKVSFYFLNACSFVVFLFSFFLCKKHEFKKII